MGLLGQKEQHELMKKLNLEPKSSYISSIFFLSYLIHIYRGVQMFVCLSVGMWNANGNPNPCTDLDEILHTHSHLPK